MGGGYSAPRVGRNARGAARAVRDLQRQIKAQNRALKGIGLSVDADGNLLFDIDGGGLFVRSGDVNVLWAGTTAIPDGSGRTQVAIIMARDDGSAAMTVGDWGTAEGHAHQQAVAWFDRSGNTVVADDTTSGQGIARPYVPVGTWTDNSAPTATTTSSSYTTLQTCTGFKQHPKITAQILVRASDGTTAGSVQITDQSENVLGTAAVAAGAFVYTTIGPVALPGTHLQAVSLNLQAKRTAGSGTIGVRGVSVVGVAS